MKNTKTIEPQKNITKEYEARLNDLLVGAFICGFYNSTYEYRIIKVFIKDVITENRRYIEVSAKCDLWGFRQRKCEGESTIILVLTPNMTFEKEVKNKIKDKIILGYEPIKKVGIPEAGWTDL